MARLEYEASVFKAEVWVVTTALEWIKINEVEDVDDVEVSSQAALQDICDPHY